MGAWRGPSAVFTRDLARGLRLAERASTAQVSVNASSNWSEQHAPFGGRAGKQSGIGRHYGRYSMEETFTELKTVFLNLG